VERRRKLLDVFVNKMSLLPHLYNYPAFQAFIKSPLKFESMIGDFKQKSYEEMTGEFINAFSDFSYVKVTAMDDEEILKTLEYFQYALKSFETFELICKINAEFFYNYENGIEDLMSNIRGLNEFYKEYYESKGFEVEKRECFTNPYLILLDWCRAEILDLKAILEAIERRGKIIKLKKQLKGKFETEHKKLASMKSKGKLPQAKPGKDQEAIVENIEKELKALDVIYKISTCQLIHKEFLVFKQQKIHKHEVILRTFSSASVEEFRSIASQVVELESN
jgi:hypothetical protein